MQRRLNIIVLLLAVIPLLILGMALIMPGALGWDPFLGSRFLLDSHDVLLPATALAVYLAMLAMLLRLWTQIARSREHLLQINRTLAVMNEIHRSSQMMGSVDQLLKLTCGSLLSDSRFHFAFAGMVSDGKLDILALEGVPVDEFDDSARQRGIEVPADSGVERALRNNLVIVLEDPNEDPLHIHLLELRLVPPSRRVLVLPVKVVSGPMSVLCLCTDSGMQFAKDHLDTFGQLAADVGRMIDGIRVQREHELTMQMLRSSESKFRNFFEVAKDAVFVHPLSEQGFGRFLEVNEVACERFGYSRSELMQLTPLDVTDPSEIARVLEISESLREKGHVVFETVQITKGGQRVPVEISAAIFDHENDRMVLSIARDITARKEAVERFRRSEERFRYLFERSLDAIFVMQAGRIQLVNSRFEQLFGYNQEAATASEFDLMDHIAPRQHAAFVAELQETAPRRSGDRPTETFSMFTRDNVKRELNLRTSRIEWEAEPAVLGILRDVTMEREVQLERKRYYQARLAAERKHTEAVKLAEESARLASIGVIAAGITHEINQPLNAIRLGADGMNLWRQQHPDALPKIVTELMSDISEGVRRVSQIVDHMRSYWISPHSGQFEAIELNRAVSSALALVTNQMQNHFISLDLSLCRDDLLLKADPVQLEQIVNNLVVNAIHALDEVEREDKTIRVQTLSQDNTALLRVSDNGPGLPEHERTADLFDPFYSTKGPGKGMGLGLAIVKMFVDRFGGDIRAFNGDEGATFEVTFQREGIGPSETGGE
jgi:PAS domain S-box-containing protein